MDALTVTILIIRVISIIMFTITFLLILRQYFQTRVKILLFIASALAFFTLQSYVALVPIVFRKSNYFYEGILFSFSITVAFSMIILFFSYFQGGNSAIMPVFAYSGIASISVLMLSAILTENPDMIFLTSEWDGYAHFTWGPLTSIIINPLYFALAYWTYKILNESRDNVINEVQERQIRIMRRGFFLMVIVSLILIVPRYVAIAFENAFWNIFLTEVIQLIIINVGVITMAYGYLEGATVAFLQPQKLEIALVIRDSGTPLYRFNFCEKASESSNTTLISGALSAITALMGEAFDVSSDIKSINFIGKELILDVKEDIAFLIITSNATTFISDALKRFATRFMEEFDQELHTNTYEVKTFGNADQVLLESFGIY